MINKFYMVNQVFIDKNMPNLFCKSRDTTRKLNYQYIDFQNVSFYLGHPEKDCDVHIILLIGSILGPIHLHVRHISFLV